MLRDLRGTQFPVIRPFEPHGQSPTRFSFCAQPGQLLIDRMAHPFLSGGSAISLSVTDAWAEPLSAMFNGTPLW
jgi:hypothetical protein